MVLGIVVCIWLFYLTFIFPFLIHSKISTLTREIAKLRAESNKNVSISNSTTSRSAAMTNAEVKTNVDINSDLPTFSAPSQQKPQQPKQEPSKPTSKPLNKPPRSDLERQFGTRIPVWIGSISLAFAGFYMIQYSIEAGLLSPAVRLILSSIFGMLLMAASYTITTMPNMANGRRIGQALAGAGIGVLYLSIYAATSMYHYLSTSLGFVAMAALTAICIYRSMVHGAPIAFMGLICGFLTPALLQGSPNSILLFSYLYVVVLGCLLVIRKNDWWDLGAVAIIGAFVWAFFWAFEYLHTSNSIISLQLFVLAICGTFIAIGNAQTPQIHKYIVNGLGLLLLAFITVQTNYGLQEWGMFSILTIGCIVLAIRDPNTYLNFTWFCMFLIMLMLYNWNNATINNSLIATTGFGLLFTVSSYAMSWFKKQNQDRWILHAATANMIFFIISYFKAKPYFNANLQDLLSPTTWSLIAIAFAAIWAYTTWTIFNKVDVKQTRENMLSIACVATTAFVSAAGIIYFNTELFAIFFSIELLVISVLSTKVNIQAISKIALTVSVIIVFSLVYQFIIKFSTFKDLPLVYFGIPAVCIGLSSVMLRGRISERHLEYVECLAIILLGCTGTFSLYKFIIDHSTQIIVSHNNLLIALCSNYYILLGIASIVVGKKFQRPACEIMGFLLIILGCTLIVLFNIFGMAFFTTFTSTIAVGSTPIFNTLLLSFALPAVWLTLYQEYINGYLRRIDPKLNVLPFALLLIFIWLTLSVRQYFHGTYLVGKVSNIETYTLSIVWLLFGISLLIIGTSLKEKQLRVASLIILILTITKVFIYDAAQLTGLLRVISFLGLGLSLIGISWFYAKYIFKKDE